MYIGGRSVSFETLVGKTLKAINISADEISFITDEDEVFVQYHIQDCCESVTVEDTAGNLGDLLDTPILMAEEVTETGTSGDYGDTFTWTFYKLATIKGYVTIRWYGESNGFYSESVDFILLQGREKKEEEN